MTATHPPGIDQSRGDVYQTGDDCPDCVDGQTIQNKSVQSTPPEQPPSALELVAVLPEVLAHEQDDEDVGDSDEDEDEACEDCEVFVDVTGVPDEYPGEVENEVEGQSGRHCRGQDVRTEIEPSELSLDEDGDDKEEEAEGEPQVDEGPDGECDTCKPSGLIIMSNFTVNLTCRCYVQLVLVGDVPHGGVEHGPHAHPGPGHGVEGGGEDEGGDAGEDEADVEWGVVGGRDISSHLSDH